MEKWWAYGAIVVGLLLLVGSWNADRDGELPEWVEVLLYFAGTTMIISGIVALGFVLWRCPCVAG